MQFLWDKSDLDDVLNRLLKKCETTRWAVAWASTSAPRYMTLKQNWDKISQLTVGIHFYQTDPKFISAFNKHPNVGFVLDSSGVFHPKVYYFEHGNGRWDCVVGSPNFTGAAFRRNSEAAALINQDDADAKKTHKDITAALNWYRSREKTFTPDGIKQYRKVWSKKKKISSELTRTDPSLKQSKMVSRSHDVPILNEGWDQYFREVKRGAEERQTDLEDMLQVLERARKLFRGHRRFSDIGKDDRQRIAGFLAESMFKKNEPHWWIFGTMRGAGFFKQEINRNNLRISNALDHIPLKGRIDRERFDAFVKRFRTNPRGNPLATATRLLAMKRPDYFLCLNSENKESFCEAYGIQKNINLDNYWPRVIERIQNTKWWKSPLPPEGIERRVWQCRVAMMDAIYWSRDTG